MATYPNGQIPQAELRPVPANHGQTAWLLPAAAESFLRVCRDVDARHGWSPLVTSAGDGFRSYARQEAVFRQRYRRTYATVQQGGRTVVDRRLWDGAYWWRYVGAAAAVPGRSNHGLGSTVDVAYLVYGTQRFRDFAPIAEAHGWSNAEGRSVAEAWHWNYTRAATPVVNTNTLPGVNIATPGGALPNPLEEDPLAGLTLDEIAAAASDQTVTKLINYALPLLGGESLGGAVSGTRNDVQKLADLVSSTRADVQRSDEVDRGQLLAIEAVLATIRATSGGTVNAAALAAALPTELARQVADELAKRLANQDG